MDSERLKYFVSAAHCLNFSEVARKNYVSQPTISHQISLLEQELEVELFFRQGKSLRLSKEGEFFLPLAKRILDNIQDATLEMTQYRQGRAGKVSIFVSETCRVAYQQCLAEFTKKHPGILLDTEVVFNSSQTDNLINGNYDVFFVAEKVAKNNDQFDYLVTHQDRLCLVLPDNIPVPQDQNDFSSLKGIPYIGLRTYNSPMMQSDIQRVFLLRNFTPQMINRCNRMEDALLSVEAGVGFSVLPRSIILFYEKRHVTSIPLEDEELLVDCVVAWRKGIRSSSAEAFISVVKSIFSHE